MPGFPARCIVNICLSGVGQPTAVSMFALYSHLGTSFRRTQRVPWAGRVWYGWWEAAPWLSNGRHMAASGLVTRVPRLGPQEETLKAILVGFYCISDTTHRKKKSEQRQNHGKKKSAQSQNHGKKSSRLYFLFRS